MVFTETFFFLSRGVDRVKTIDKITEYQNRFMYQDEEDISQDWQHIRCNVIDRKLYIELSKENEINDDSSND